MGAAVNITALRNSQATHPKTAEAASIPRKGAADQ
jgi:hypothetical protein